MTWVKICSHDNEYKKYQYRVVVVVVGGVKEIAQNKYNFNFEIQNSNVYARVIFPRFPDGADASVFKS